MPGRNEIRPLGAQASRSFPERFATAILSPSGIAACILTAPSACSSTGPRSLIREVHLSPTSAATS